MGEQTKIRSESIVIMGNPSFIAGTYNEVTKAEVDKTNLQPEKASYPFILTAKTVDGKAFEATGNTSENQAKIAKITNYKVDDKEHKLPEPLEVKIEDGKLATDSLKKFEQLINKSSAIFDIFGSRETIKSEHIPSGTLTLSVDKNMKAALAQVNEPTTDFKSAFNTVPNKQQDSSKFLG